MKLLESMGNGCDVVPLNLPGGSTLHCGMFEVCWAQHHLLMLVTVMLSPSFTVDIIHPASIQSCSLLVFRGCRVLLSRPHIYWRCSSTFWWTWARATAQQDEQHSPCHFRVPAVIIWLVPSFQLLVLSMFEVAYVYRPPVW